MSAISQTPLTHTSFAAFAVQVPFRVGPLCVGSDGIGEPLASLASQACVDSSHQSPPVQSPSVLHPPAGSQVPATLHAPDRHTVAPFPAVHGPSPLARPHSLSAVSQTAAVHTAVPTAAVQVPVSGGVWPAKVGIGIPLATFGTQVVDCVLQYCVAEH